MSRLADLHLHVTGHFSTIYRSYNISKQIFYINIKVISLHIIFCYCSPVAVVVVVEVIVEGVVVDVVVVEVIEAVVLMIGVVMDAVVITSFVDFAVLIVVLSDTVVVVVPFIIPKYL